MKHELDAEEYQEKAALYALGALSQHEARAFERHLAEGCSFCESELLQFEEVTGALSFDAPAVPPPAYLRDVLLVRIDKEARTTGPANRSTQLGQSGSVMAPGRRTTLSEPAAPSRSFGTVVLPWAAAASLAIAVGALLFALSRTARDVESLRVQLEEKSKQVDRLAVDLTRERNKAQESTEIIGVLAAAQHREIVLTGQPPAPSSSGRVYWEVLKDRWVVISDLPPPPKGKVYQLWFLTNKKEAISAGLIPTDDNGHGFKVLNIPGNIAPIAAAAITLEPEGGSQTPTLPIYTMGAAG